MTVPYKRRPYWMQATTCRVQKVFESMPPAPPTPLALPFLSPPQLPLALFSSSFFSRPLDDGIRGGKKNRQQMPVPKPFRVVPRQLCKDSVIIMKIFGYQEGDSLLGFAAVRPQPLGDP